MRTRHLALAASEPDAALATTIASAAVDAAARGAVQAAVELAAHALRLTPDEDERREERLLELAWYLVLAGEKQRVTDLLVPALESISGVSHAPARTSSSRVGRSAATTTSSATSSWRCSRAGRSSVARHGAGCSGRERCCGEDRARPGSGVVGARGPRRDHRRRPGGRPSRALRARLDTNARRTADRRRLRPVPKAASPAAFYLAESPERIAGQRSVRRGEIDVHHVR